mgnify:CR=1 FL=1
MGKMKDQMISDMNINEVKELLNNFNASATSGYIKFLENQLKEAEEKVSILTEKLSKEKGES